MRKPRHFDAELKALEEKARELKARKVLGLGELVIATGADSLSRRGIGRCADRAGGNHRSRKEGGMGQAGCHVFPEPGAAICSGI
jgi:hypothetical protein